MIREHAEYCNGSLQFQARQRPEVHSVPMPSLPNPTSAPVTRISVFFRLLDGTKRLSWDGNAVLQAEWANVVTNAFCFSLEFTGYVWSHSDYVPSEDHAEA